MDPICTMSEYMLGLLLCEQSMGEGGILETEEDVSEDDHFEINSQCNKYNYEHNEETA